MTPRIIQHIADSATPKRHLFSQHPVLTAAQTLRRNFANIIGTMTHCPRCLLRGENDGHGVRWTPEPFAGRDFQEFNCPHCGYGVKDR